MVDRLEADIEMLNPDQTRGLARVEWWSVQYSCNVSISYHAQASHSSATDFFEALAQARRPFECKGYRLLCYGASRDIWPSGMARDMGLGLRAYKLSLGQPGQGGYEIFEAGPDVVASTVEEQAAFAREWWESVSKLARRSTSGQS
jgi:hypothetical protein